MAKEQLWSHTGFPAEIPWMVCCKRVRINGPFSQRSMIIIRGPSGSVLGPALFHIVLSDLEGGVNNEVAKCAEDTKSLKIAKSKAN